MSEAINEAIKYIKISMSIEEAMGRGVTEVVEYGVSGLEVRKLRGLA